MCQIEFRRTMKKEGKRDDSGIFVAIILIVVGILWALQRLGVNLDIGRFFWLNIFDPFRNFFSHFFHLILSWQMIFIIVGIVLLAGKRSAGWIFLVIGGIFLLPRFFEIPGLTASLLLPVALVAFGIAMILRSVRQ